MDDQEFTPSRKIDLLSAIKDSQEPELHAQTHKDLVARYSVFKKVINPQTEVVYHPSCATDVSPSAAFPNSKVIYVDIDDRSMKALRAAGYDAHTASALEYNPGPVNVLILLNPAISPDIPSSFVVRGGYILCNDWHSTATSLKNNPDYRLVGVVVPTKDGYIIDTEQLEDYWKEIETEEEWKNARFTWGGAENYESAANVVEIVTGKRENILTEFKRICKEGLQRRKAENAKLLEENPQMAPLIESLDADDALLISSKGRQLAVETTLPKKKGVVDDIFIFQKK